VPRAEKCIDHQVRFCGATTPTCQCVRVRLPPPPHFPLLLHLLSPKGSRVCQCWCTVGSRVEVQPSHSSLYALQRQRLEWTSPPTAAVQYYQPTMFPD
jgi:hypothetical protein